MKRRSRLRPSLRGELHVRWHVLAKNDVVIAAMVVDTVGLEDLAAAEVTRRKQISVIKVVFRRELV